MDNLWTHLTFDFSSVSTQPWIWTQRLLAFSALLQVIELWRLRNAYSDTGVWRWATLRKEPGLSSFDPVLAMPWFHLLLAFEAVCAGGLMLSSHPLLAFGLFATMLLVCIRWRGTVNGGSDYMSLLVCAALNIALVFGPGSLLARFALLYLAVQVTLSYFLAGWAKVVHREWRQGEALRIYATAIAHPAPKLVQSLLARPHLGFALSWGVMGFELLFPLAWLNPEIGIAFVIAGLLFHLINAYVLGLNRFFWAWLAAYPAFLAAIR